jgi:hypothetical protein
VLDLHVARADPLVLDHERLCARPRQPGVDQAQGGENVEASLDVGGDAVGETAAAAEVLGIDRRDVGVAGDREGTALEAWVGPPDDRRPNARAICRCRSRTLRFGWSM